jgi:hypothetical protein
MSASAPTHRFHVGDRVQVERANPAGNPRTPAYIRGKRGVVTALHGSIVNPLDHRGVYPPLCSVLFQVREVFGGVSQDTSQNTSQNTSQDTSNDTLSVDLHEDWLAPAETAPGS